MTKDKKIDNRPTARLYDIQLREINLRSCQFKGDKTISKGSGEFSVTADTLGEAENDDQGNLSKLLVKTKLVISGKKDKEVEVFAAEMLFVSEYFLQKPRIFTEEDIQKFVSTIPMLHVWPYARETIDWLTRRAGIQGVTLPIIAIPN